MEWIKFKDKEPNIGDKILIQMQSASFPKPDFAAVVYRDVNNYEPVRSGLEIRTAAIAWVLIDPFEEK